MFWDISEIQLGSTYKADMDARESMSEGQQLYKIQFTLVRQRRLIDEPLQRRGTPYMTLEETMQLQAALNEPMNKFSKLMLGKILNADPAQRTGMIPK